tara:strand:+ start:2589 stop:3614 length:1026 start_codon:yes stop_codon:yes gene_type:complete
MIKIKLYELDKHRNECAFRPYLWAQNSLREIGIEFTQGDSYDYAWVAQASFLNKKVSLEQSVNNGLEFLSKITGDYMLLDGQDSTSLIGAYEIFKESNALLLLKNSLLKDRSLYKQGSVLGRNYWGPGDYKLNDFDQYSDRIVLSGTNWLMTHWSGIKPRWYDIPNKQYDISAMFQYPQGTDVYEHDQLQSVHYDNHRKPMIDILSKMDYNIAKLDNGVRVSEQEYYQRISNAKILLAPYGYGEMAPRDLDAAQFGSILIKPDMEYIETVPNIFKNNVTYIACKHDYSDLEQKIDMVLSDYNNFLYIIENARKLFEVKMRPETVAMHLHKVFSNLNGIENE